MRFQDEQSVKVNWWPGRGHDPSEPWDGKSELWKEDARITLVEPHRYFVITYGSEIGFWVSHEELLQLNEIEVTP